ncbi:hypothetical protein [Sphingomonas endolithica]|uniref:hypothetical protein n=1 Tax=Sphingomonas endolithica TaxID=2972485 RepID=UPI0021AF0877|nr:hypothetical protein [Sphingomonas sp. ZFBP2030]
MKVTKCLAPLLMFAPVAAPAAAAQCPAMRQSPRYGLAHPTVSGSAGPFAKVTLTLLNTGAEPNGPFTGLLSIGGGRCLKLAGPDEPGNLFILQVKAVMFTPIDPNGRKGIVILYDSHQIGPGHGTDARVLVYRITAQSAERDRAIEERLEGAKNAGAVRQRLG